MMLLYPSFQTVGVWMNRRLAAASLLASAIFGFGTVIRNARAIDSEPTSAILTPEVRKEIAQVESEIDRTEARAIERLAAPPDNQVQQIELLGKAMLYDKDLSVNRNEACAFCHMPETGFTARYRNLTARPPLTPARRARATATANRNRMLTPR